jgi:alpha-D-ribose 1-methylphosphonate 5-triphosphate synthase subunit PhnH
MYNPVTQQSFRQVLQALASPGQACILPSADLDSPFSPAVTAILLTLVDRDSSLALPDYPPKGVQPWLSQHLGLQPCTRDSADFVLYRAANWHWPALGDLPQGSESHPEQGATLILDIPAHVLPVSWSLRGPGRAGQTNCLLPLDAGAEVALQDNAARYPRGIDILLCQGAQCIGLPRSIRMEYLGVTCPM